MVQGDCLCPPIVRFRSWDQLGLVAVLPPGHGVVDVVGYLRWPTLSSCMVSDSFVCALVACEHCHCLVNALLTGAFCKMVMSCLVVLHTRVVWVWIACKI